MATARKSLVWNIRKKLLTLSAEDIYQVVENLGPEADPNRSHLIAGDHEACFDYISSFLNSKHLLDLEDSGMAELLILNDTIDKIDVNRDILHLSEDTGVVHSHNTQTDTIAVHATHPTLGHTPSLPPLSQSHSDTSDLHTPNLFVAQPVREGMISLRELSYLQRREFKVQGGQIGDQSSDISYNNVCKQIEEGIREGFSDTEVVRGVLQIIRPGAFKEMLTNKDELTVLELKGFLQAHLREKNSTELFGELMSAKQEGNETPQQFLYRVIALKQRVLITCKLSDAGIKYSAATVQDVFLQTVKQGLGDKYSDLRRELKVLLDNSDVSDETIVRHVMRITSEESERQKRIGLSRRQPTSAHSAQLELNTVHQHNAKQESTIVNPKPDPVKELTAKVDELTKIIEAMKWQSRPWPTDQGSQYSQDKGRKKKERSYGCPKCVEQNRSDCPHCFSCGEEGHRAMGCLKRQKNQGNANRSLPWGNQ